VHLYRVNSQNPDVEEEWERAQYEKLPTAISDILNEGIHRRTYDKPELLDFYNEHDQFTATNAARNKYNKDIAKLEDWQKALLTSDNYFYVLDFSNLGGLVMPVILEINYADNTKEELRVPAEIWRRTPEKVSKLLIRDKEIKEIILDPHRETADVDVTNNYWPARPVESRFDLFKKKKQDMMRDYLKELEPINDEAEHKEESGI
jgi:hypothetical protein